MIDVGGVELEKDEMGAVDTDDRRVAYESEIWNEGSYSSLAGPREAPLSACTTYLTLRSWARNMYTQIMQDSSLIQVDISCLSLCDSRSWVAHIGCAHGVFFGAWLTPRVPSGTNSLAMGASAMAAISNLLGTILADLLQSVVIFTLDPHKLILDLADLRRPLQHQLGLCEFADHHSRIHSPVGMLANDVAKKRIHTPMSF